MKIERLHPRMAAFSANAEALADFALHSPVVDRRHVAFSEYPFLKKTSDIEIGEWKLRGFAKSTDNAHAIRHVCMSMLATLLGAPSAPYIMLTNCIETRKKKFEYHDGTLRLFSIPPFDDHECAGDLSTQDMAFSAGAAGQFRSWINDKDSYASNIVRCRQTGDMALFDHECAEPAIPGNAVYPMNKIMIACHWRNLEPAGKEQYTVAAQKMADRIYHCPDTVIHGLEHKLRELGLHESDAFFGGLKARRALFRRPVVLDALKT